MGKNGRRLWERGVAWAVVEGVPGLSQDRHPGKAQRHQCGHLELPRGQAEDLGGHSVGAHHQHGKSHLGRKPSEAEPLVLDGQGYLVRTGTRETGACISSGYQVSGHIKDYMAAVPRPAAGAA